MRPSDQLEIEKGETMYDQDNAPESMVDRFLTGFRQWYAAYEDAYCDLEDSSAALEYADSCYPPQVLELPFGEPF